MSYIRLLSRCAKVERRLLASLVRPSFQKKQPSWPSVPLRCHGSNRLETIHIRWIGKDGKEELEPAAIGDTLMEAAQRHDIPIEGACAGVCACSTCHVILERKVYDSLPEPSETEEDMLDQAYGLTATSRLGCQVKITADMDKVKVTLPKATRNFYVDGHVPKHH